MSLQMVVVLMALLLAGCETVAPPTITPTRSLSGPTLAPSPDPFTGRPTELPPGGAGGFDPTIAGLPSGGALPPITLGTAEAGGEAIEVVAADGTALFGRLYRSPNVRDPGVLLLAPAGADWSDFPARLSTAGYTVLLMDAHGIDFDALLDALATGGADPGRIAAIGAAEGADLVLAGCAADELCDAAGLLSPLDPAGAAAVAAYNPRPLFISVTEGDSESFAVTGAIRAAATGDVFYQPFNNAGRGTALLINRPDLGDLLITWLDRALAS